MVTTGMGGAGNDFSGLYCEGNNEINYQVITSNFTEHC